MLHRRLLSSPPCPDLLCEEDLPGHWLDLADELARRPSRSLCDAWDGAPGFLPYQGLLFSGQSLQKAVSQTEEGRLLHHLPGPCLVHPLLHLFLNPVRCQGRFSRCQKGKEHGGPPRLPAATEHAHVRLALICRRLDRSLSRRGFIYSLLVVHPHPDPA